MIWLLLGCSQNEINIYLSEDQERLFSDYVEKIGDSRIQIHVTDDVEKSAQKGKGYRVALLENSEKTESYLIEEQKKYWSIQGDYLGLQYGLSDFLEAMNYRFYHPYQSYIPEKLSAPILDIEGEWQSPEMERRGIHLHTLHPIEGYYDFWEAGAENLERAERVVDWLIKNRGNYLEWVALDNITDDPLQLAQWQDHHHQIVEYIHQRGATTGIGVQLFGSGNLQNAFDLIDNNNTDHAQQITERMEKILDGTQVDVLEMSFGEFFEEEPQRFIDNINQSYDTIMEIDDSLEMTARIHVGDDLQVEYQGQEMIYYLLAAYANPEITPWVHTVMYYNLFQPSNGAYHHQEFDQHREFLFQRLEENKPVAYFPESAYWVAFDNSVPVYLPLYIRSRFLDMFEIKQRAVANGHENLNDHTLFSSGWEWGYWQNDVTTLRMNWRVPDSYLSVLEELFSNFEDGETVARAVYDLAELQNEYLIEKQLDAYYSCVDNIMEIGYTQDIISQPKRPSFSEMLDISETELQKTIGDLVSFSEKKSDIKENFGVQKDPWLQEIYHGMAIDVYRSAFMASLIKEIVSAKNNEMVSFTDSEKILQQAQNIVDIQHGQAWDPKSERLFSENRNATIYQFGYLYRAEELCYWNRELIQVKNLLLDGAEIPPGCGL